MAAQCTAQSSPAHDPAGHSRRHKAIAVACGALIVCAGQAYAQDAAPSALSETYGDWVVQCASAAASKPEGGQEPVPRRICQVSQSLAQGNSNQRVLMIVFEGAAKDKQPLAGTVIAPFGVDLASGLSLRIRDNVYAKAAYKTCLPQGCVAPVAVDAKFEAALRANEKMTVAMTVSDTGAPVSLDVSLKGLAQSLDRLKKLAATGG